MTQPAATDATVSFPLTQGEIDLSWLSAALASRHPGTVVERIVSADARHGTTTNIKLQLVYADGRNPHGLPQSVWFKGGMEAHSDQLAAEVGIYEREARFYLEAQPRLTDISPWCLYADYAPGQGKGVTILEDIPSKGAEMFHSTRPITLDDSQAMLKALAFIHRAYFGDPIMVKFTWLPVYLRDNDYWDHTVTPAFLAPWLKEPRADTYPRVVHDVGRISANLLKMAEMLVTDKCTLVHGDAHVGNAYRLANGEAGFYDWQCTGRASPIMDVAYNMISSLDTAVRRENERALIEGYLDQLNAGGHILSFDEAWLAYRRYAIYGLWAWMTNPTAFHPETVNITQSNRFASAVADLETFEAIEAWA